MKIRLMIRGYLGRTLQWEKPFTANDKEFDQLAPKLVDEHIAQFENFEISMIEIEFLDEPDVNQRFYRFGTSPAGMVLPLRIDL